jgi:CRP-like cAMP-binding protein
MRSMSHIIHTSNRLLASLPFVELDKLRPHLTRVRLVTGQVLLDSGQNAEHVFFVEEAVVGLMASGEPGQHGVQVAMIGREGMIGGLSLLTGGSPASAAAVTQIAGPSLRILSADLRRFIDDSPALRDACLHYVIDLTRQVMANAACNARCTLAQRCLRWLRMAHERMDGHSLPVTQEELSARLGVRRSGVAVATAALQAAGLIHTSRGRIKVLDAAFEMAPPEGCMMHDRRTATDDSHGRGLRGFANPGNDFTAKASVQP